MRSGRGETTGGRRLLRVDESEPVKQGMLGYRARDLTIDREEVGKGREEEMRDVGKRPKLGIEVGRKTRRWRASSSDFHLLLSPSSPPFPFRPYLFISPTMSDQESLVSMGFDPARVACEFAFPVDLLRSSSSFSP